MKLKNKRLKLVDLGQKVHKLRDQGEFFEFMKDERKHQERNEKLEKYPEYQQKLMETQHKIETKNKKLNYFSKLMSRNVGYLNSAILKVRKERANFLKKYGGKNKTARLSLESMHKEPIESPYKKFNLDDFIDDLMKLSSEVFSHISKSQFEAILKQGLDVQTYVEQHPEVLATHDQFLASKQTNFLSMSQMEGEVDNDRHLNVDDQDGNFDGRGSVRTMTSNIGRNYGMDFRSSFNNSQSIDEDQMIQVSKEDNNSFYSKKNGQKKSNSSFSKAGKFYPKNTPLLTLKQKSVYIRATLVALRAINQRTRNRRHSILMIPRLETIKKIQ